MLWSAGMQGGMGQGPAGQLPVPLTPYGIELTKSAAAAGYFADGLRPEERQRSYLTLQQVDVVPAPIRMQVLIAMGHLAIPNLQIPSYLYRCAGQSGRDRLGPPRNGTALSLIVSPGGHCSGA